MTMPITLLDGILVGFTLVSAMLAMVRGFSREVLSIASWAIAALAAFFLYPYVLPYVTPYISNEMLAMAVAAAAIFFIALDHRDHHHDEAGRFHRRFARWRTRSHTRFSLRRGTWYPRGRRGTSLSQLAHGIQSAELGERSQVAPAA